MNKFFEWSVDYIAFAVFIIFAVGLALILFGIAIVFTFCIGYTIADIFNVAREYPDWVVTVSRIITVVAILTGIETLRRMMG